MMAHKIVRPKTIQKKSRTHEIRHISGHTFEVTSGASGKHYTVTLIAKGARCTCKWGQYRPSIGKSGCSHVTAVYDHIEAQRGRSVSVWTDPDQAKRQHRPSLDIGDGVILTSRVV